MMTLLWFGILFIVGFALGWYCTGRWVNYSAPVADLKVERNSHRGLRGFGD